MYFGMTKKHRKHFYNLVLMNVFVIDGLDKLRTYFLFHRFTHAYNIKVMIEN